MHLGEAATAGAGPVVAEAKVKLVASQLLPVLDDMSAEEVGLILPTVKRILGEPSTAILGAWHLWAPVAKALGSKKAAVTHFLDLLVNIYEGNVQTCPKHLKLYHRSFVLNLIVRFGTKASNLKIRLMDCAGVYFKLCLF